MDEGKLDNANKVAKKIKEIIDKYWKGQITEAEAREILLKIISDPDNRVRVKRGENYTGVFKNVMGKRRIEEFESLTQK